MQCFLTISNFVSHSNPNEYSAMPSNRRREDPCTHARRRQKAQGVGFALSRVRFRLGVSKGCIQNRGWGRQTICSCQVSLIIEFEGCIDLSAGEHVYRYSRREDHLSVQGFDGSWQSMRQDPNATPLALRLHGFPHVRCI